MKIAVLRIAVLRNVFVLTLVLGLSVVFAMPTAQAEEVRPKLDDLVEHFIKVLYGSEYSYAKTPGVVAKWAAKTVNFTVQGNPKPKMLVFANNHFDIISRLTKVKFRKVPPGTKGPGIDLIFLKRADMDKLKIPGVDPKFLQSLVADPTMVCYFLKWHDPPERIIKAIVVINAEKESVRIGSCLLEELTQVMGLPNDSQTYWKTLFNPNDVSFQHSPWDMLYLKTLYDPRLKPGMKPDETRKVVRKIFAKVLETK